MALYFASAEDLETIDCFLDFHEIRESPKKMQKLVANLLVSIEDAQFASVYLLSENMTWMTKEYPDQDLL